MHRQAKPQLRIFSRLIKVKDNYILTSEKYLKQIIKVTLQIIYIKTEYQIKKTQN